jgi:hypothetical protein
MKREFPSTPDEAFVPMKAYITADKLQKRGNKDASERFTTIPTCLSIQLRIWVTMTLQLSGSFNNADKKFTFSNIMRTVMKL